LSGPWIGGRWFVPWHLADRVPGRRPDAGRCRPLPAADNVVRRLVRDSFFSLSPHGLCRRSRPSAATRIPTPTPPPKGTRQPPAWPLPGLARRIERRRSVAGRIHTPKDVATASVSSGVRGPERRRVGPACAARYGPDVDAQSGQVMAKGVGAPEDAPRTVLAPEPPAHASRCRTNETRPGRVCPTAGAARKTAGAGLAAPTRQDETMASKSPAMPRRSRSSSSRDVAFVTRTTLHWVRTARMRANTSASTRPAMPTRTARRPGRPRPGTGRPAARRSAPARPRP